MSLKSWLSSLSQSGSRSLRRTRQAPHWLRLAVEALEDRLAPATFTVTLPTDSGPTNSLITPLGPGTVGDLRNAIFQADQSPDADNVIDLSGLSGTVDLAAMLPPIFTLNGGSLTIIGPGQQNLTISGEGEVRPFFILEGDVSISNLTIANGLAKGGNGGPGAGGGAGLGGGLLIDGTVGATTVSLTNVTFDKNQAVGGTGTSGVTGGGGGAGGNGGTGVAYTSEGAGGGFLGNGGNGLGNFGGGGGGFTGAGGNGNGSGLGIGGGGGGQGVGSSGGGNGESVTGNAGGGGIDVSGFPVISEGTNGTAPVVNNLFSKGGDGGFGGGGGAGGTNNNVFNDGGNGGDYGGSAGGGSSTGVAGFGGGGGWAAVGGGVPGFGGGGGGWQGGVGGPGIGSGGAGQGAVNGGGGGAGLGGGLFQRAGTLNLTGVIFTNNTATGGVGSIVSANSGTGHGGGLYVYTGATANLTRVMSTFSGNSASSDADYAGALNLPTLVVTAGTPQSTLVGSAFFTPLQVLVLDIFGDPVSGATITFAAPIQGATATFSSPTAVTDASGQASVIATANNIAGSDTVSATGFALANDVTFSLTNKIPSVLTEAAGSPQSTLINSDFGTLLTVDVKDILGNPVPGTTVTFTTPTSGASATLSSTTAVTDLTGLAEVLATANGTAGSYTITASVGALSVTFNLTNNLVPTVVLVTAPGGTYDGSTAFAATVTVSGSGTITGVPSLDYYDNTTSTDLGQNAPINAGNYTVTATYAGDATHASSTDSASFDVLKATSATTATGGNFVYDGTSHGGSGSVNVSGGSVTLSCVGINGTIYSSPTPPINAGSYTVTASYAGDENHLGSSASASISISKAASVVTTVGAGPFTYDGTIHSGGSGTVSGVGGLSTNPTSLTYSGDQTNAGNYTVTAHYAGDANHLAGDGQAVAVTIQKAASTVITAGAGPFTYDGTTHEGGSGTVTGVGGLSTNVTSLTYTGNQINAGSYTVTAHYAGDANHLAGDGQAVVITIQKATSTTISLGAGPFTYDGTAHSGGAGAVIGANGLNTNATSLTYTGDQTNVGTYMVTAHYAGDANHLASDGQAVAITIQKAASSVMTVGAGPVTYDGTTHMGGSGLVTGDGGLNTAATTLTYVGDQINAGTYFVVAHFAGDANHLASDGAPVAILIQKAATITVTVGAGPFTYDGNAHTGGSGTVSGDGGLNTTATSLNYTGDQTNAGSYTVTAHYAGDSNHLASDGEAVTITIQKATSTVTTVGAGPFTYDGTTHSGGSGTVTGTGGLNTTATSLNYTGDQTNAGTYTVTAHYVGDVNHLASDGAAVAITIQKAASTITTVGAGPFTFDGTLHSGGSGTVTGAGGLNTTATSLNYTGDQTNAGTYAVTAHYVGDANHLAGDGQAVTITIQPATPILTVTGGTFGINSGTHSASATVTGVNGTTVAGAVAFTYNGSTVAPSASGVYAVAGTFTSTNSNYSNATASATITILTIRQQIVLIESSVSNLAHSGVLPNNNANHLLKKLVTAADKFDQGNTKVGIKQLTAFIKQVNSLKKSGKLTSEAAQPLINAAQAVIGPA
jgi:hypothetical protein